MSSTPADNDSLAMNLLWHAMRGDLKESQIAMFRTSGNMPVSNALDIYKASYWARLYDALAETFPLTLIALGEPRFRTVVAHFVRELPSIHPELEHLGVRLPQFLRDRLRAEDDDIADIAAFEQSCLESFMAPDQQTTAALTQIEAARFSDTVFVFAAHVRLAQVPLSKLSLIIEATEQSQFDPATASCFVIHRPHHAVLRTRLSIDEFNLLQQALSGASVAHLLTSVADDPVTLLPHIQRWFSLNLVERMEFSSCQ
jgi:hypothetical protein